MEHPTEITSSVDEQISQLPQTEKDEKKEERKGHHIIDIKERIDKMIKDLDDSSIKSRTIFKVNMSLRKSNPSAYTPKMVSIGPYHRKNSQLHPMEKYKLLYLQRFFQRKEGFDMKSCINELEKLKEEALKCYEDIEELGSDNQFCQMLLLDGCFVVEFIRECCDMCLKREEQIISFGGYICHQIFRDLMLLENQLPFFVLNKLHDMTKLDDESSLLILVNATIIFFVDLPNMIRTGESFKNTKHSIKHLLHAVHIASCHGKNPTKDLEYDIRRNKVMPNATELSQAGVSFVKAEFSDNLGDITSLFDSIKFEKGLMTIPCFRVYDGTETILRNLIAYEQQSSDVQYKYFTDFAAFMDHLIDSERDVSWLRQNGIIENWMGEDKEVASLFNKNGNGVTTYSEFFTKKNA